MRVEVTRRADIARTTNLLHLASCGTEALVRIHQQLEQLRVVSLGRPLPRDRRGLRQSLCVTGRVAAADLVEDLHGLAVAPSRGRHHLRKISPSGEVRSRVGGRTATRWGTWAGE